MKMYKVEKCKVEEAEFLMNNLAGQGWNVISVMPDAESGSGMVIAFEKLK